MTQEHTVHVQAQYKKPVKESWTLRFNWAALIVLLMDALNQNLNLFEGFFTQAVHYQIFVAIVVVSNYILRRYRTNSQLVGKHD